MLLVVDSGSTKTDYSLINSDILDSFHSLGFNPILHSSEYIQEELVKNESLLSYASKIEKIFYYGAGCSSPELKKIIQTAFENVFKQASVIVEHDMLGAVRATCGKEEGIAAILGTGSNSCYFDGKQCVEKVPSIGYLLGDEGSGCYLGKKLITAYLYNSLPKHLSIALEQEYNINKKALIRTIYEEKHPNRYLASFSLFLKTHENDPFVRSLIMHAFNEFLKIHILCYEKAQDLPIHFIGSIAFHFQEVLSSCCKENNLRLGKVLQKPMDGLVAFHLTS